MTAITMFGLALAPLYAAIAEVESGNGRTSRNVYQIDEDGHGYIEDVNRIYMARARKFKYSDDITFERITLFKDADKFNRSQSEYMMGLYWSHWGAHYEKKTGNRVTYEVLARIHNGGPLGWKKPATLAYWAKVSAAMDRWTMDKLDAYEERGLR